LDKTEVHLPDQLQPFTLVFQDGPEIKAIFTGIMEWLEERYPGLSREQRKAMAVAIFEAAFQARWILVENSFPFPR
jgi:hypothetical protein